MTREEAIKIIESNCSCTDSKLREACAMFIPELAESEDEKIRKWLIGYFEKINNEIVEKDRMRIIAYLEKQKEQKPINIKVYEVGKGQLFVVKITNVKKTTRKVIAGTLKM